MFDDDDVWETDDPNAWGKLPPFNPEAEAGLLSCCLQKTEAVEWARTKVEATHFFEARHAWMYRAILENYERGKGTDKDSVMATLYDWHKLDRDYVLQVWSRLAVPAERTYRTYTEAVFDNWRRRQAIELAARLDGSLRGPVSSVQETLEQTVEQLAKLSSAAIDVSARPIDRAVDEVVASAILGKRRDTRVSLKTGIPMLDQYFEGMKSGTLTVIGARPGVGKSAFAIQNLARHALSYENVVVLVFSLEMGKEELAERLLASVAQVPHTLIRRGNVKEGIERIQAAQRWLSDGRLLVVDDPTVTVQQMAGITRQVRVESEKRGRKLLAVVVDYIQLANPGAGRKNEGRHEQVGRITRELKILSKTQNCAVIALSQLNRSSESEDRAPGLRDLRESGSIEQDADNVLFIHRKEKGEDYDDCELILAKQRAGRIGTEEARYICELLTFEPAPPGYPG